MQNSVLRVAKTLPPAIERLSELAINLWFSWNYDALELFAQMDPVKWAQTGHNPVRLLYDLDDARLDALSHNTEFLTQ